MGTEMITKLWQSYLLSRDSIDEENKRRVMSMATMAILGIVIVLSLIIKNGASYPLPLTILLLSFALILTVNMGVYVRTQNIKWAGMVACGATLVFNAALIYSGGKEGSALYWVMFVPLVTYSITGPVVGSIFAAVFLFECVVLLYGPDFGQFQYPALDSSRALMSSGVVVIFSFINEFYRSRSHSNMESLTLIHKRDANTDPLTKIPNRRFLESTYYPHLMSNSQELLPATVILADIDHFKMINDTYGHDVGDDALVHAVDVFKETLRQGDLLCRYGGEEFLICLPNIAPLKAAQIADKVREALEQTPLQLLNGSCLPITCSFGVAEIDRELGIAEALKQADLRLYQAKEKGRNLVVSA